MQLVEVIGINIKNKKKYTIMLKGDNKKGYRAYIKDKKEWRTHVALPEIEFKIVNRLFNGTNTDLYFIDEKHQIEYTAIENYYMILKYKGKVKE